MPARKPSAHDDIIDSRDIIAWCDELEPIAEADPEGELFPSLTPDEIAEARETLDELNELLRDIHAATGEDPKHGAALINDSYFAEYAQEYAEDIGAIPRDAGWPCMYIDWERAAASLQMDYFSVTWSGVTFWVR